MRPLRLLALCAVTACLGAGGGTAAADPGEDHGHDDIPVPTPALPAAGPGIENMSLLDVAAKPGTTNSDMAFYGNLAYVGNYDGFRIIDISRPDNLQVLSDFKCRAVQSDLSVFRARDGRMILLQSIDRPVTAPDCTAVDTPLVEEDERGHTVRRAAFGFEGLRMFDVTDPRQPRYLRFIRTECGSHTHTLVPNRSRSRMFAYVASYPLGSGITPEADAEAAGGLRCDAPHRKISVVSIPSADPEAASVRKVRLSEDTEYYDPDGPYNEEGPDGKPTGTAPAFQACHDHQAFLPRDIVVASCAGDLQYWSVARRGNPTSRDGQPHTHIKREVAEDDPATADFDERWDSFDFIHSATVTWDGEVVTMQDESGGGGAPRCDAQNTRRGWTFLYPLVTPGEEVDGFDDLLGRYMIPRPQGDEICVSHNGNVLPTSAAYVQAQGFYMGGTSVWEFTDPSAPTELAWADLETSVGASDVWASYWYNDVIYVNGGLNRRALGNRGLQAFSLHDEDGDDVELDHWRWLNPQTQEVFQVPDLGDEED